MFLSRDTEVIGANSQADCHTYAVIDAMQRSDISVLLNAYDTEWSCLWKGDSEQQFAFYAPYIVKLEENSPFADWLLSNSWGKGWGIYLRSYGSLEVVTHHLRKFNQIYDEVNGQWLMFRYYAPVSIKTLLPFLPAKEFIEFTDGLTQILSEDPEDNTLLVI
ncbi:DUF4123 domain-containing protein [Serratia sp. arafor3]|uniref:DUF4123 domain-containing protein n=2 Tax=Serratia silvae TaxID=2824122 RepID=A0ABT0KE41_9GAMM|nr:DUF4123 domain-containing protein [Serratia silvae]